eukprot:363458_1
MASLGDHANKLKSTLGEQKNMMQYVPPNMNNTLDLGINTVQIDSDTEDTNDNTETVTKITIWSQTMIVLKAGSGFINEDNIKNSSYADGSSYLPIKHSCIQLQKEPMEC